MSDKEDKNPAPKKKALGRGLGALLTDSQRSAGSAENNFRKIASAGAMDEILLTDIETNPYQPRTHFDQEALEELAESIKIQGIIQPITVRKLSEGKYQLISGERRLQASKLAGLRKVPAYVRTANDQQMLEMALIENIQRENLNAIEIALSYQRLLSECELKQEQLGERVGKKRTTVNNYLRLLKLPPDIQVALRDNKISMGHARAIINIDDPARQLYIFNKIMQEGLSVRNVEKLVRDLTTGQNQTKKEAPRLNPDKEREYKQLQYKLSSHFGTKVNVRTDEQDRGEIKIPFVSTEDLNRILELLNM
ncbi:ParB/RepB/Spo0J family partition protein [Nafulsella turpanensis]|uniref:ParB/RepB/Spo0J family partition protein n=1 Tax=Nafulsella turpanensis TaxID=1265690 RepID=UPI000348DD99|nr:ParB/RepB/Spo0J family partition protein [Nafulsella turpanensis]